MYLYDSSYTSLPARRGNALGSILKPFCDHFETFFECFRNNFVIFSEQPGIILDQKKFERKLYGFPNLRSRGTNVSPSHTELMCVSFTDGSPPIKKRWSRGTDGKPSDTDGSPPINIKTWRVCLSMGIWFPPTAVLLTIFA